MEIEITEMRLAEFETRLRQLEQTGDGLQGANPGIPPFVPIPFMQTETATSLPRPFDIVDDTANPGTRKIVNCKIPCPITVYTAADYTINGTNDAYLHVDYSNAQYVLTVDQASRPNSATHAQFKLYEFSEQTGAVTLDLRPAALPLFAL